MAVRLINKFINFVIYTLILAAIILGICMIYDVLYVYSNAADDSIMKFKPSGENQTELKELSEDAIGWITFDETTIDYPLMQGVTNNEYLNKDPYGEYSLSGSIFLDYRNASDLTDDYNLIYGHHMSNGLMFGALDDFGDENYFMNHCLGQITLTNGQSLNLEVFAFGYCDAYDKEIFDPQYNSDRQEFIKNNSVNYKSASEGRLVVLTTCRDSSGTEREFLACVITE